jgi:hypothetical protein
MRNVEGPEMACVPESGRSSSNAGRKARPIFALPVRLKLPRLELLNLDANAAAVTSYDLEVHCERELSATVFDGAPDYGPKFALLDEKGYLHWDCWWITNGERRPPWFDGIFEG